MQRVSFERAT